MSVFIPRITRIFSENLLTRIDSPTADLLDSGLLDSMKFVELLLHLEQEFGIRVAMEELDIEDFRSLERIAELVEKLQNPVTA